MVHFSLLHTKDLCPTVDEPKAAVDLTVASNQINK